MRKRELPQDRLALRGDLDEDFTMIEVVTDAPDDAQANHPVDEFDDGVVLELKLPGQGADRGQPVGG